MRVDLHNHTTLCNHATGSMHAYIEKAIESKIDIFGFSEHAPMPFDEHYRMKLEEMQAYKNSITQLQVEFGDAIDIRTGLEVDYLPGYMLDSVLQEQVDYLIGSVHFIDKWGFDNPEFIGRYKEKDIDTIYSEYFDAIEAMAKSGHFDIVGHLDLIKVFNYHPTKDIRLIAKNALKAIKEAGMVLELNVAGYRKPVKEQYPSVTLLEEAYALDIPITFSSDAHTPEQVGLFKSEIEAVAQKIGYSTAIAFKNRQKETYTF